MVSPNNNVADIVSVDLSLGLIRNLAESTGLIESRHGCEILLGDGRRVGCGNKAVRVARVTDHENLDSLLGVLVEGLALSLEDASVLAQQIFAFHTWATRNSTNEDGSINVLEAFLCVSSRHITGNISVSRVFELHDEMVKELLRHG